MRGDGFDYGRMMQRALRGVMAEALGQVARRGLPGEHHFFISFRTTHPGVDMPDWLKARHPDSLAIVLQHEFSDLAVAADRFSVRLSFADRAATLVVPFDAVTTFADPSENFGLRFDAHDPDEAAPPEDDPTPPGPAPRDGEAEVVRLDRFRKR
jgi:hypothetical protein